MPEDRLDVDALYAALDEKRRAKRLSWRQLASEAAVSASTFSRLAQGRRPDVDTFGALIQWLGMPAEAFLRSGSGGSDEDPEPMAVISSFLRASKELTPESAKALEDIIRAAYQHLKKT
jgi:transcriptional regulator with XRE-family HTH domain